MQTVAPIITEHRAPRADRPAPRVVPVWCVVPWFNQAADVRTLLADLAALRLETTLPDGRAVAARLHVLLVDNASTQPLRIDSALMDRAGIGVESIRLGENRGGSGGFNAGLDRALQLCQDHSHAYAWLIDSDARPAPGALLPLLRTLESRPDICVAGSAIADPDSGRVFEIGGIVDRRTGSLRPAAAGAAGAPALVDCDYVASCSALVRMDAARRTGPMPDFFLHADDVCWMLRMKRRTGARVVGVGASVVYHPRFDRFALRGRYFAARNGLACVDAVGAGRAAVARRALREAARAVQQELMGRPDLAMLHLAGLRDALGSRTGRGRAFDHEIDPFRPLADLPPTLASLGVTPGAARLPGAGELGLSTRDHAMLRGHLVAAGLTVNPSRPRRSDWSVAPASMTGPGLIRRPRMIQVVPGVRGSGAGQGPGFVARRASPLPVLSRALVTGLRGVSLAARLGARRREQIEPRSAWSASPVGPAPTLSIVIISYNRWEALRGTLARIASLSELHGASVVVVDNASGDGSPAGVEREFPQVHLIRLEENIGVGAFNVGVEAATGELVLVLDDDAWPDVGAVEQAVALLARRADIAAVALHPRHPSTSRSEWRAADAAAQDEDRWPIMGCGNLVRREAWLDAGGYEPGFFLYRNDVDLALKLLGAGWGVCFNPAWTVWHDSPAATRKSPRWHRLATRNWIWLAKRHGRGAGRGGALGMLMGWLWAHRLAGRSLARQLETLLGCVEGVARPAPPCPARGAAHNHLARYVRLASRRSRA